MTARDIRITPQAWSPRGEAVVHGSRKELILWGAIPGEEAFAHLYHEGEHQDHARFIKPTGEPHPLRREPPCDRYNACGGCPLMHLTDEGQVRAKLHMVKAALAEHGLGEHAPLTMVASPDGNEAFRHVAKVAVGLSDMGHLRTGAFGRGTRHVVPIPSCNVVTPEIREVMKVIAFHVIDLAIYPYEPELERGLLRHLVIRQSRSTGEILITVVAARKLPLLWELAERLAGNLANVVGVHLHVNDDPDNAIFSRDADGVGETIPMRGKDAIEETLNGLRLRVGPADFYQTNPGLAELLVSDVVSTFSEDAGRPAVDLYCGVGGITLALARSQGWAFGVEGVETAVDRARENATLNKLAAEFAAGDVLEILPDLARRLQGTGPVVCVDPARRGLEPEVAAAIRALEPARLAYVSCNPRALARDLAEFVAAGWSVDDVRAYDMFPQTSHTELLARLSPPAPPSAARRPPRRKVVR